MSQGVQTRSFKYDSLGRLTRQKLAEQTATLSDAGCYVGTGCAGPALWSDAFTYDARSNITNRTDARGVQTTFSYDIASNPDPLNRLQSISYSTSGSDTTYGIISAAASVSLSYMTTGDQTRVSSLTTAGVATETNAYDPQGRISDYTLTLTNRSSYQMQTSYEYDTANRLTKVKYPVQYSFGLQKRKEVVPSYDQTSRISQMNVENYGDASATQLSDISYNTFGQVTSLKTGLSTGNADVEQYSYDGQTGLLTNQRVYKASNLSSPILDLSYDYSRGNSVGTLNGKTGQLTGMANNLDRNKDRAYEFDALGRLTKATGGATGIPGIVANWTQNYSYDRYGNKTAVTASGITADSNTVPSDGLPSLTYDTTTNRITPNGSTNWQYDNAGNLIRGQNQSGVWQRFEYDAAGRLVKVKDDSNNVLETYTYGYNRNRLVREASSQRTYYSWGGSSVLQEYVEATASTSPIYSRSYIYAGSRLLSTATTNAGSEIIEFHHPDRVGTKLVTNPSANTTFEQSTLPFGTSLPAESYGIGSTNQKFTSYDRSFLTDLDDAVNRTYSSGQSRFTQVDIVGMSAATVGNPQSNNLFSYVQNEPVDFVDPSGLLMIIWWNCSLEWGCYIEDIWEIPDFNYSPGDRNPGPGGSYDPSNRASSQSPPPCNAQLTGDAEVDKIAQVLFGESVSGNRDTYKMMGNVINNRYQMGLKEFGCSQSSVALTLSIADDANNFGYRSAGSNKDLSKLSVDQCNAFKVAQDVANDTVHGDISKAGIAGDRRLAGNTGAIPLWWRGGIRPAGNGQISVGDTTFLSFDPSPNAHTNSNDVYKKYSNKFEKNVVKAWHCGM